MADDRLQISIGNDGLVAKVSLSPGSALATGAIAAALDEAGVVHGIDERALVELENRVGDERFSIEDTQIASATPAIRGIDGELVINFTPGLCAGIERADGSLDLLNRGLLQRVSSSDSLGFVRAPTAGIPGVTVTGDEIPPVEGKPLALQFGDGVEVGSDGAVTALRDGAIHFRRGTLLDVLSHYEHKGHVDIRSGHLETAGSVSIGGSVNANFEVRAGGDVAIRGAVIGGRVVAGGNVQVMGAIAGGENGYICAAGDIRAKHAQIADLRSGGTVTTVTDCVGSLVHARRLEVGRSLLGGEAIVETSISTKVAGSRSGAGTVLMVGEPYECDDDAKAAVAASSKIQRQISRRYSSAARGGREGKGKRSRQIMSLERDQTKRHIERAAARSRLLKVAVIDVTETVNVGVQIRFGNHRLDIETTLGATRFQLDETSGCIVMERTET